MIKARLDWLHALVSTYDFRDIAYGNLPEGGLSVGWEYQYKMPFTIAQEALFKIALLTVGQAKEALMLHPDVAGRFEQFEDYLQHLRDEKLLSNYTDFNLKHPVMLNPFGKKDGIQTLHAYVEGSDNADPVIFILALDQHPKIKKLQRKMRWEIERDARGKEPFFDWEKNIGGELFPLSNDLRTLPPDLVSCDSCQGRGYNVIITSWTTTPKGQLESVCPQRKTCWGCRGMGYRPKPPAKRTYLTPKLDFEAIDFEGAIEPEITFTPTLTESLAEEGRSRQLIGSEFEIMSYAELPVSHQLAVAWHMAVDHNEWWSAFTPPSYAGADLTHELQSNLHRYIERFGDVRFGITSISDQQAKEVVMTDFEILREHGSFEAYHQKFLSYAPIPGYAPEDRWPLILAKDTYPSAFIDGYARLHSYLRSGHRDVPVIFFADQHQL